MADQGITPWLGKAARDLRLRGEMTMMDIANRAGTSEATVSRFESGSGQQPLATTDRIIAAYAVELDVEPVDIWRAAIDAWTGGA